MENKNTVAIYDTIAELTNQMLMAAKLHDWDLLLELESSCAEHVEKLKFFKDELPLSSDTHERKVANIKRILADDREIRDLISPRMARLSSLISSSQTGKKLTRAYGQ
ncbi:MAG: flagellar protein FliT [Methylotenera sp.]